MSWSVIAHVASPTSDQLDFTGLSLGAYQRVVVVVDGVEVGTDGAFLNVQLGTAASIHTTGYRWRTLARSSSGSDETTSQNTPGSGTSVRLIGGGTSAWGIGNAASESGGGVIQIGNVGATNYKLVTFDGVAVAPSGAGVRYIVGGILEQTGAITDIRVLLSTGTMDAGMATLYGLTTS